MYLSRLLTDGAMDRLQGLGYPLVIDGEAPPSRQELLAGITGAVATLTERIDAEVLAAAGPQVRIVANVAVGYDNIDIPAAEAAGRTVTNTPGVLDQASADHTFALIPAVCGRVAEGDRLIRSGQPWVWGPRMLFGLDISADAQHWASSATAGSARLLPAGRARSICGSWPPPGPGPPVPLMTERSSCQSRNC